MKKALCLYGKIGSSKGNIKSNNEVALRPFLNGHNSFNLRFKNFDGFDVFIHTWDIEHKEVVTKVYNPTDYQIEEQKQFDLPEHINEYNRDSGVDKKFSIFKIYSRWYSAQQSLLLKSRYEKENDFTYDLVISSRFDNIFNDHVLFDFEDFTKTNSLNNLWSCHTLPENDGVPIESPELKDNCIVNGQKIKGIPRLQENFIFSNSENMDTVSSLFDNLSKYGKEDICYDFDASYAQGKKFTNHRLLPHHLSENNIDIALLNLYKRKDFNIYYIISNERKTGSLNPKPQWAINTYKSTY